ncbi:hypothetical protein K7W42_05020 [Deinococcus sp. HMF7604]|uniref:hypothetical protein n=1 Tax=Deinococcus betulae TaxID=2873312 RepID=UPI001CCD6C32|nr:hypothetical protein [Deinococcus betulae]MBZ9750221.1 hypothetical protein [Deinococcus betulae]
MSLKTTIYLALFTAVLAACSPPAAPPTQPPAPEAHVLAVSGHHLYAVNLSGGADVQVATLVPAIQFSDLARQPQSGNLYAVTSNMLFRVDPQTGAATAVGGKHMNALNALAFNAQGDLFAGDEYGHFYRIDPVQGVATQLNAEAHSEILSGDLAFAPDGTLYATVIAGASDRLVTVNSETGAVSNVGLTGFEGIYGLSFVNGVLYGMTAAGEILILDQATGAARLLRRSTVHRVYGLE